MAIVKTPSSKNWLKWICCCSQPQERRARSKWPRVFAVMDLSRLIFSFNTLEDGARMKGVSFGFKEAFPSPLIHWRDCTQTTGKTLDIYKKLTGLSDVQLLRECPNLKELALRRYLTTDEILKRYQTSFKAESSQVIAMTDYADQCIEASADIGSVIQLSQQHEGAYGINAVLCTLGSHCRNLTSLKLEKCKELLYGLSALPSSLSHLHIEGCQIDVTYVNGIGSSSYHLEELTLISNRWMEPDPTRSHQPFAGLWPKLHALKSLSLQWYTPYKNREAAVLANCGGRLTYLNLRGSYIDNDILASIVPAHPLTYVDIRDTRVSAEGLKRVMRNCPRLINFRWSESVAVRNRDQLYYNPESLFGKFYKTVIEWSDAPMRWSDAPMRVDHPLILVLRRYVEMLPLKEQRRIYHMHHTRKMANLFCAPYEALNTLEIYLQARWKEADEEALLTHVWDLAGRPELEHLDEARYYAQINPMRLADALARLDAEGRSKAKDNRSIVWQQSDSF